MSLANKLRHNVFGSIAVIYPVGMDLTPIFNIWSIFNQNGIPIPQHKVIIFPDDSSEGEVPTTHIAAEVIMLFPTGHKSKLVFQYLHELCHLLVGDFPQEERWIGEILACSCNYFWFPKSDDLFFYQLNIGSQILSYEQNKSNFKAIESQITDDPYLVYKGDHMIESALLAYQRDRNSEFDFAKLLKSFIDCRDTSVAGNAEKRATLISEVKHILMGK